MRRKILLVDEAGNKLIKDTDNKLAVINRQGRIVSDAGMRTFVRNAQKSGFDVHVKKKGKKAFLYGGEIDYQLPDVEDFFKVNLY